MVQSVWLSLEKISPFLMRLDQQISALLAAVMILSVSSCATKQSTSTSTTTSPPSTSQSSSSQSNKSQSSSSQPIKPGQSSQAEDSGLADQSLEGQASWYGPGFYGQKTTSGDVLQKGTMTAAHSSLPMGTEVKVTRLDTNESVIVEINDRKPYKEGTLIDLAQGAAEAIDLDDDGTAQVKIEVID